MENTMRLREHEAKQRIESMKTQAVFSVSLSLLVLADPSRTTMPSPLHRRLGSSRNGPRLNEGHQDPHYATGRL